MRISINLKVVLICMLSLFVMGCAMKKTQLTELNKVKIINSASSNCKKLGEVNSSDYSRISLDEAEKTHQGNIVILKNSAAALGANAIVLTTHATNKDTETFRAGNTRIDQDIYTHTMMAIAYYCR